MKRVLLILVCLLCAAMSMTALADAQGETQTSASSQDAEPEALFERYIEGLFDGRIPRKVTGLRLSGSARNLYTVIKAHGIKVASGEESSTDFTVPIGAIYPKTIWTAEDLGVEKIADDDGLDSAAELAIHQNMTIDLNPVMDAVLCDCPYDFYWYDKVAGMAMSGANYTWYRDGESGEWQIELRGEVEISLTVSKAFRLSEKEDCKVDTSMAVTARTAVKNAQAIVQQNAGKSDLEKLIAYKDAICDLVSYNDAAAASDSVPYGNPWQLIWVFDGDEATNVVCEGYSKAFQYLCDNSAFMSDALDVYTVSGTITTDTGGGPHMWNIVTMEDNRNYLVDVTNSDAGTLGENGGLFLNGCKSGSASEGYIYEAGGVNISYTYADRIKRLYSATELTMTAADHGVLTPVESQPDASGVCGDALVWELRGGALTVTGEGAMYDYSVPGGSDPAPWAAYFDQIETVAIGEGVSTVGDRAFYSAAVETLELPQSLGSIGRTAFAYCKRLAGVELPQGLTTLGESAFMGDTALSSVRLPDGTLSAIPQAAFYGCTGLTEIELPDSITAIEPNAFYGSGLQAATLSANLVRIGAAAFAECSALAEIHLPDSLTALGDRAFYHDTAMKTANVPGGVNAIPTSAFEGCASLVSLTLSEGIEEIGAEAFFGCASLTKLVLPETLKAIGMSAFESCRMLEDLHLGASLAEIKAGTFLTCPKLASVDLPNTVTQIGYMALGYTEQSGDPKKTTGFTLYGWLNTAVQDYAEDNRIRFIAYDRHVDYAIDKKILKAGESTAMVFSWSAGWPSVPTLSQMTYKSSNGSVATAANGQVTAVGPGSARITVYIQEDLAAEFLVAVRDDSPLTIPSGIEEIEDEAFMGLTVREIDVPEGVTKIGARAFADCPNLSVLDLPDSLVRIDASALSGDQDVVVCVGAGTAAYKWAVENDIAWEYRK